MELPQQLERPRVVWGAPLHHVFCFSSKKSSAVGVARHLSLVQALKLHGLCEWERETDRCFLPAVVGRTTPFSHFSISLLDFLQRGRKGSGRSPGGVVPVPFISMKQLLSVVMSHVSSTFLASSYDWFGDRRQETGAVKFSGSEKQRVQRVTGMKLRLKPQHRSTASCPGSTKRTAYPLLPPPPTTSCVSNGRMFGCSWMQ